MPKLISAPFFSANPVFRRAEYASAVGRRPQDKVVTAMLAQHLQAGNIRRIARGVFASVPKHADPAARSVDRFLPPPACARTARSVITRPLNCTAAPTRRSMVCRSSRKGTRHVRGKRFRLQIRQAAPRLRTPDGIVVVDRLGQELKVTTIERTIADLFNRYDLAGGAEELFNSLDLVVRIEALALVRHVRALGKATTAVRWASGWSASKCGWESRMPCSRSFAG